jgi:hypothetical protein
MKWHCFTMPSLFYDLCSLQTGGNGYVVYSKEHLQKMPLVSCHSNSLNSDDEPSLQEIGRIPALSYLGYLRM